MATTGHKEVAETCFSYLHMELVQMAIGDFATATPQQVQRAGRKIESVGFQVGQRLVERYTKDSPRFTEMLDIIKFICKDFWFEVYRKQIDKLQTNNRVRPPASGPPQPTLYCSPSGAATRTVSTRRVGLHRGCTCCRTTGTGYLRAARPRRSDEGARSRWRRSTLASPQVRQATRCRRPRHPLRVLLPPTTRACHHPLGV